MYIICSLNKRKRKWWNVALPHGEGEEEMVTGEFSYRNNLTKQWKKWIIGRKKDYKTQPKVGVGDFVSFVWERL